MLICHICEKTCQSYNEKWYRVNYGVTTDMDRNVCDECLNSARFDLLHIFRKNKTKLIASGIIDGNCTTIQWIEENIDKINIEFDDIDPESGVVQTQYQQWKSEAAEIVSYYYSERGVKA